ncbi:MAG TPA: exodeoxyribonuclease V subunit gamma, partial [Solirubrobacteraceae bacterium]|nr:exodeoxyribonuclease V subunit gamma [Solirubrobacteraceae bacterium]
RAVWPLLEVVDECLSERWMHLLAAHLGGPAEHADPLKRARRFATVRHLAELFDGYALHRPDTVRAWAASEEAANEEWQGRLWRCLRARIGEPGPAERLERACQVLEEEPGVVDLPAQVSIFGLTRLPAGYRDILESLAARRDLHLFLLHPSPALWDKVGDVPVRRLTRRQEDPTAELPANRLLASWGRDAREMQVVLQSAEHADHQHPVEERAETLLGRIQADVRADASPAGDAVPAAGDRSVEIHACHGRARQVEVLRDAILHLLRDDPTLEPRDVIVMCPDIETFAPLIHATFGAAAPDEDGEPTGAAAPDLRVRLADRAVRQTNPVLGVIAAVLDLADDRVTASQVLDLAGHEPVRRRFGLDDEDLARLEEWVSESGVRWGLDARRREAFKLGRVAQGTWAAGLRRVLVGVTMTEDERRLVDDVLPLDDVDSGAIELAGRLAELVDRLDDTLTTLSESKPVADWTTAVGRAADLLTDTNDRDAWQRHELDRLLGDLDDEAGASGGGLTLGLPEVRSLLHERLQGRPTRANFRTGHLTFCTLMPMRSVPHRVVCLLGLDDGVFPRKAPRDGDDLRLEHPHVGERDPRSEDRQLLLDALMAAGDRLLITYTGRDERTNAKRPPAVPVGELLDIVDRTVRASGGTRPRDAIVVHHPLQPFDPENFTPGALAGADPWSFDRVTLDGARHLTHERPAAPPFLPTPLPPTSSPVVELDDLLRFVQHPVRAFLRQRLGLTLGDWSTEIDDALPVALDGLEEWGVGQRMLDAYLEGCDARAICLAEMRRGHLPPGVLGKPVVEEIFPMVERIATEAERLAGSGPGTSIDVRLDLPDGRALTGTVGGVRGDVVQVTTFSKVSAKHRLAAWVRVLALSAAHPERGWTAVTVGRGPDDGITVARIRPIGGSALGQLAALVDLHDRGLREPVPLAARTSAAYARARTFAGDAERAARKEWETDRYPREDDDADHVLAFGGRLPFEDLLAVAPHADEDGPGWDEAEPSRFGRLAMRLWAPLLAVEERQDL